MRRRHAADALEERRAHLTGTHAEEVDDGGIVGPARHRAVFQERADLRGEEQPSAAVVVVEGPHAERVARAQHRPGDSVPEREGEVADETADDVLSPAAIAGQDEVGIAHVAAVEVARKRRRELAAVVESTVPHQPPLAEGVGRRLLVRGSTGLHREEPMPQRDRPTGPLSLAVGPTMGERREHPHQERGIGLRPR